MRVLLKSAEFPPSIGIFSPQRASSPFPTEPIHRQTLSIEGEDQLKMLFSGSTYARKKYLAPQPHESSHPPHAKDYFIRPKKKT